MLNNIQEGICEGFSKLYLFALHGVLGFNLTDFFVQLQYHFL